MPLRLLKNWWLVLYIFMVVYAPAIGPNPALLKLGMLIVVPMLLSVNYASVGILRVRAMLGSAGARSLILGVGGGAIFVVLVMALRGRPIESFEDTRFVQNCLAILVLINAAFIVDLLRRRGFSKANSFEVLLWLGSFQGVIAILGVMNPAVKEISNELYNAGGASNEFVEASRIYGWSSDFTYGTPIYHGALAGLAVYAIATRRAKYYLHIPLILTVVLLNGRTGLIVFALVAVVSIGAAYLRRINIVGLVLGLAGVGSAIWLGLEALARYVPRTYEWVNSFFVDTDNLVSGGTATGNYTVLTREILFVPDGLGLWFGEGVRLYEGAAGSRTDIGFTNDLFAGGLVYWALAYGGLLLFIYAKGVDRAISLMLVLACVVANLKGELLHSSVILFIVCFVVLSEIYGCGAEDEASGKTSEPIGRGESAGA